MCDLVNNWGLLCVYQYTLAESFQINSQLTIVRRFLIAAKVLQIFLKKNSWWAVLSGPIESKKMCYILWLLQQKLKTSQNASWCDNLTGSVSSKLSQKG